MPARPPQITAIACVLALASLIACAPAAARPPVQDVRVIASFPHDPQAFTEGLFYSRGELFESTGLEKRSTIRRVRLADGAVLQSQAVDPEVFGEGMVDWGDELLSLTWQHGLGYRWDRRSFALKGVFRYTGEGWGLTRNEREIIMSDGSPVLRVLDPQSLKVTRRLKVTDEGRPVRNLNELEWVRGEILANVWLTNLIARIDPQSGKVKGWIDLSRLPEAANRRNLDAIPNGIAYDAAGDRLFVTGKYWPRLYQIELLPPEGARP